MENETILSALLVEMENLKETDRVIVVGTSNLDRELDSNIKRSGRFEK
jgi:SpoVK/Ycf46/Vps4 family AAA+-type ATPase